MAPAFLDELLSGIASVAAPALERDLDASHTWLTATLFFVPGLLALAVEPILFVWADGGRRRLLRVGGLVVMGLSAALAATTQHAEVFMVALAFAYVASGPGVALSQADLVDAEPEEKSRALARWSLASELGDLAAPALIFGLAALGVSTWRWGLGLAGSGVLLLCAFEARTTDARPEPNETEAEEEDGALAGLKKALRQPLLMPWLGLTACCNLMDELLTVMAALHLASMGADAETVAMIVGVGVLGSIVGAASTERALRWISPRTVLGSSALGAIVLLPLWSMAEPGLGSALLFGGLGAVTAAHYPIAMGRAYEALPGRSGSVNAALHAFTPLTISMPLFLGWLADARSVQWSLGLLAIQPVAMMFAAFHGRLWGPSTQPRKSSGSSP